MTYTEIIDNIQTRIENIISDRFSGSYTNIKIEPSKNNPDIDEEITVTITVTDQNDDPISNWNVPLAINGTLVATTLTTDNNGQVTYNHTCSDWGICRFSVKSFISFINVTGWKRVVNQADGKIQVYTDGETAQFTFQGSQTINANNTTNLGTIPSQYAPQNDTTSPIHYQAHNIHMVLGGTGAITVHNATSTTSVTMRVLFTYALKSKII